MEMGPGTREGIDARVVPFRARVKKKEGAAETIGSYA
jgi:hypothetical protein